MPAFARLARVLADAAIPKASTLHSWLSRRRNSDWYGWLCPRRGMVFLRQLLHDADHADDGGLWRGSSAQSSRTSFCVDLDVDWRHDSVRLDRRVGRDAHSPRDDRLLRAQAEGSHAQ